MSEEKAEELTVDEQEMQDVFDEFETEEQEAEVNEPENKTEIDKEPEYSELETEARKDGHTTKAEWEAAGKDPERWKSPHEFVEYGKIKGALDKSKADQDRQLEDFDKRLENVNKIHQAETKAKLAALKDEQRQAMLEADEEKYDKAEAKIEAIKEEVKEEEKPKPQAQEVPQVIQDWETKNPWINTPTDPRTQQAWGLYNGYVKNNPNGRPEDLVAYVNEHMGLNKPATNPRREAPSETMRAPASAKKGNRISMSTLTDQEKEDFRDFGADCWPNGKGGVNEKDFLQSVADSRKGL